jgi:hypothetical protein
MEEGYGAIAPAFRSPQEIGVSLRELGIDPIRFPARTSYLI